MSEIDIERLKVDADYWDEVAHGSVTHYCPEAGLFYADSYPISPSCIPRPTKRDREGGLPPVGSYSRISRKNDVRPSDLVVKIVCYTRQLVIVANDVGTEYALSKDQVSFGPEMSEAEMQRGELISIIEGAGWMREEDTADAILSRYNLEPKP